MMWTHPSGPTFLRLFAFYLIALSDFCFAGMINTHFLRTFDSHEHQIIFQYLVYYSFHIQRDMFGIQEGNNGTIFAPKFGALNHYTYIMERNLKT